MASLEEVNDLRSWLDLAGELGEVRTVTGAHWDKEIGAASEVNYRRPSPPALLFDDIVGYRPGQRVLTATMANARRLGMTLRLGTYARRPRTGRGTAHPPGRMGGERGRYPVREVGYRPVCENVLVDGDANLLDFPVPQWHEADGGRYIGTGCAVFTTDPDTGTLNAGAYRMQVQNDGRAASVNIEAGKHGAAHVRDVVRQEGRAPVTASLGHDPLLLVVAGTEVPDRPVASSSTRVRCSGGRSR